MSGIVFFATTDLARVVEFYTERLDATVWLEQPDCTILAHDEFRFGFCERAEADTCGVLTFYDADRAGVDDRYDRLADVAEGPPVYNETYDIYQFFATDPDGRTVECQTFCHDLPD
ncbi:VOC family protein [Halobacteriales archaeon Cl-PHB]